MGSAQSACPLAALELVVVRRVAHPRVDARVDRRPEVAKGVARLLHAFERDVRVLVAASEEYGGAVEAAVVRKLGVFRPD